MVQDYPPIGRLVAVGGCSVESILSIPHYPEERSELQASANISRRGGNCPSTLEVLRKLLFVRGQQYELARAYDLSDTDPPTGFDKEGNPVKELEIALISMLPASDSQATDFIRSSLGEVLPISDLTERRAGQGYIDLEHYIYSPDNDVSDAASIISLEETSNRTMVSYNKIPSMPLSDFEKCVRGIHKVELSGKHLFKSVDDFTSWYHFEGRDSEATRWYICHLRDLEIDEGINIKISVELEDPHLEEPEELEEFADTIFYSRSWAAHQGYTSPLECIEQQAEKLYNNWKGTFNINEYHVVKPSALTKWLFCTWGEDGAAGGFMEFGWNLMGETHMTLRKTSVRSIWTASETTEVNVMDLVDAGAAFIAGMMYAMVYNIGTGKERTDDLAAKVDFANEVARRKVWKAGFNTLALEKWESA